MVLIDCARTDSFTLSACLFSTQNVSRVSSSIPSALPLLTFLLLLLLRRLSVFSFTKHISRFRLLTSHRQHLSLTASPFLMKFFFLFFSPPPCFVVFPEHVDSPSTLIFLLKSVPTGASQRCHCKMYYLPLTSRCSLQRQNTPLVAQLCDCVCG